MKFSFSNILINSDIICIRFHAFKYLKILTDSFKTLLLYNFISKLSLFALKLFHIFIIQILNSNAIALLKA